ncbi:MAG: UV DNA damage repair endonuclease UvsE [Gemmatimonadaceae bacterium]
MTSPEFPVRVSPRLGLCCAFVDQPDFKFRTTTVAYLSRLAATDERAAFAFYERIIAENLDMLARVVAWCADNGIHAFRINSDLWPRATHPMVAPWVAELFTRFDILTRCTRVRELARARDIRLSEHPDQFLVGNSLRADVVASTITELEWRGRLGDALGVDVICLHVGSGAPDRESALWRWDATIERLSTSVLSKLALENDDRTFAPEHMLPACLSWNIPLVYDAHHHRVLRDSLSEEEATEFAIASWGTREPYFHLSSPRAGWNNGDARPHHEMIEPNDWPEAWTGLWEAGVKFTVDIEAKAKERAVLGVRALFV